MDLHFRLIQLDSLDTSYIANGKPIYTKLDGDGDWAIFVEGKDGFRSMVGYIVNKGEVSRLEAEVFLQALLRLEKPDLRVHGRSGAEWWAEWSHAIRIRNTRPLASSGRNRNSVTDNYSTAD